jgi:pimeloyl-ACP methyl ester carboxylesterase
MKLPQHEYLMNSENRSESLLVLLPGAGNRALDFETYGFIAEARQANFVADILTVDCDPRYFADLSIAQRIHDEVIIPAKARGYRSIWLGGISLGGFGSLIYAERYAKELSGLVLIAPYLGNKGTLAEIERGGGLERWEPGAIDEHDERRLWKMIQQRGRDKSAGIPIKLLFGQADRFSRFHQTLASRIDASNVLIMAGGHDWQTWQSLWQGFLSSDMMLS